MRRRGVVDAVVRRPFVDGIEQPPELEVRELALVSQGAGELGLSPVDPGESADQLYTDACERIEVERGPLGCAGELHRRNAPRPYDVVDLVEAFIEHAGCFHPPVDVPVAVHAWPAYVFAYGESDLAAGALDFGGNLHPGRRCANHEHTAFPEQLRVPVF